MDIEKLWQAHQPQAENLPGLPQLIQKPASARPSPLKRMKRMLKINMGCAVVIAAIYIVVIGLVHEWQVQLLIGIALVFTLWGALSAWRLYKRVDDAVLAGSLLTELQRNRDALQAWLRLQIKVSVCVYPFCVAGGFLLGGVIGTGKSVEVLMSRPHMLLWLTAAIIILAPIGYGLTKWMFRQSFQKVVIQLDSHIRQLTGIEE